MAELRLVQDKPQKSDGKALMEHIGLNERLDEFDFELVDIQEAVRKLDNEARDYMEVELSTFAWLGQKTSLRVDLNRILRAINKLSILSLSFARRVCQINLYGTQELDQDQKQQKGQGKKTFNDILKAHWPKLVFVLHWYCSLKLLVNIFYQYEHDFTKIKLNVLTTNVEAWDQVHTLPTRHRFKLDPRERLQRIEQCQLRLNETRSLLKALGAPHINATITIECIYITFLMLTTAGYLVGMIYFRYFSKFDFHLLRCILNRQREARQCNRMTLRETNKFIDSSRSFTLTSLEQYQIGRQPPNGRGSDTKEEFLRGQQEAWQETSRRLVLEHRLLVRQLRLMARHGILRPLNRTDRWLDLIGTVYFVFTYGTYLWAILFCVVFYRVAPVLADFEMEFSSWTDHLLELDLLFMSCLITISVFFYLSSWVVCCLDQARLISQVHKLILDCRVHNTRAFNLLLSPCAVLSTLPISRGQEHLSGCPDAPSSFYSRELSATSQHRGRCTNKLAAGPHEAPWQWKHQGAQMNARILKAILHYKIFVAQLRPLLKPGSLVTFVSIGLMITHSLMIRAHVPYVENAKLEANYYIISLITSFFVNFSIVPICFINSRCSDLYRALYSLLAHTIEVSAAASKLDTSLVYDAHSVFCLRQELKHSHRFVRQFETRAFGLKLTYSNLLKFYFYVGLLVVSIFFESGGYHGSTSSRQASAGNTLLGLFEDPFRVYANV